MEERERRYYDSLYEAAAAVNSARTTECVLNTLAESVTKALEARACSLMLLTPDRKTLLHTAAYGLSEQFVQKGPVSADKSIAEALQGKPVSILNVAEDERVQYPEQDKQEGIASILCVPMTLREEIIGVVRVYTAQPRHFAEDDIHLVQAVANLGAIALENATLFESCQKDRQALRGEVREWRAAFGVWPPRLSYRR